MRRALAFLTPLGGAAVPDARTVGWFPVVGALIGAGVGAAWSGADEIWAPLAAAAVAVVVDLVLTGLLHVDGLADTADGLIPQVGRERRLEIMADPAVGAYGAAAVTSVILLRVAALGSLGPDVWLLAAVWCASRTSMAVAARALPYARPGGLAADMQGGRAGPVAVLGVALALGLAVLSGDGFQPIGAVAAAFAGAAGVVAVARRRLGGFTGDVLGAAGLVGETVALLVAASSW